MIHFVGTGPQNLLSSLPPRLSPIMNQCPAGTLIGTGKSHSSPPVQTRVYESFSCFPFLITCPPMMEIISPGPATTLLTKVALEGCASVIVQADSPKLTAFGGVPQ